MTGDFLATLARANLALAAAIVVVALLRGPFRRAFGARVAYALWAAPLLTTAAIVPPHRPVAALLAPWAAEVARTAGQAAAPALHTQSIAMTMVALWALGAVGTGLVLAVRQARFLDEVRAGRAGPAVVGLLRPRVVTPSDFARRFAPEERAVILQHEAQHIAHGDPAVNALTAALQCLCWFNPLVHVGAALMRLDQELACDAAVLAKAPAGRRLYAEALLKTQLGGQAAPLGCHWPAGSWHPLRRRIAMLNAPFHSSGRRLTGLGLVALFGVAGAVASWLVPTSSFDAAAKSPIAAPHWVRRPVPADIARFYPAQALAARLPGRALIDCRVSEQGALTHCAILSEGPAGAGFGQAALAMTQAFQMSPAAEHGRPVAGGRVRIPIHFMPAST